MAKRILFQGDSITDALRNRENDNYAGNGYPTLIKGHMGYDYPGEYEFLNRGISGNRIVDVYARIKCDIINLQPDCLSILIGVNDVWHDLGEHGNGVAAPKFERIYDMLIDEVKEVLPNIQIMLLEPFVLEGPYTRNIETAPDRLQTFQTEVALRAQATRRVAEKHHLPLVELQGKFNAACEKADPTYWLIDGVHPSAMGHELIARAWIETFQANMH